VLAKFVKAKVTKPEWPRFTSLLCTGKAHFNSVGAKDWDTTRGHQRPHNASDSENDMPTVMLAQAPLLVAQDDNGLVIGFATGVSVAQF